ncbi:MAG TPA: hypothetical protein VFM36_02755 [Thermoanaerobaculia bacterium]|nr:hypothetical protein [Thermoanaerobaculia bacterium]
MNKRFDAQDLALRTLIVVAGALAATWFALNGEAQALPGLAIGGTLGAVFMARLAATQ